MSSTYVLPSLLVLVTGLLGLTAYAVKRYFDDRAAARAVESGLGKDLVEQMRSMVQALEQAREELRLLVTSNDGIVRERLGVFEKALANSISQFAEIVASTKESELQNKARIAGALVKSGRRLPAP